jgi:Fic family protein
MKPYIPEKLPTKSLDWSLLVRFVGQANSALARFDGILQGIVNPNVLLSPLTTQEAVLSSKIEGTQATLEEVLEYEAAPREDGKSEDIHEILNYRRAMRMAVDSLKDRPISLNLLKEIQFLLLDSVRGKDKGRGEFRTSQNWIGRPGCKMEEASYVPPPPLQVMEFLDNLEKYVRFDEEDRLVQMAIIHAQFEIIHPFLDGNGRVGRILVPLFLFEKGQLSSPMFYLSTYLEAHREVYYDRLQAISRDGDWT